MSVTPVLRRGRCRHDMTRIALLPAVVATACLGLTLTLTGCSPAALPGSPSSGGNPTAGTSPAPAAAAAGAFAIPKSCLSAADVSATLGVPAYGPTVSADSTSLVCEYFTATEDGPIIDFEPSKSLTATSFAAQLKASPPAGATATAISGLGDAAVLLKFSTGTEGIFVLAGKVTINIAGGATSPTDIQKLTKKLLAG